MKHLVCRIASVTVGAISPYHMDIMFVLSNFTHLYSTFIMFLLIFESIVTIYRPINWSMIEKKNVDEIEKRYLKRGNILPPSATYVSL